MSTASRSSSRCKPWTYCLLCHWLGCQLCSGGLKECIFLCLLSWTLWCILWCCTGKLSPLNGDPERGFWMGVLNGAIRGLNGGCTGQSYRADLGTIEVISMSWSFWCLARFPMTDGSLLNGGSEWGHKRLEWGPYRVVVWGWSWYHWTCLIMLIILISDSFFYEWWFSFEWGSWMGILNGAVWGLNGGCMGQSYGADLGTIELISSTMTLPWVILLAAGDVRSGLNFEWLASSFDSCSITCCVVLWLLKLNRKASLWNALCSSGLKLHKSHSLLILLNGWMVECLLNILNGSTFFEHFECFGCFVNFEHFGCFVSFEVISSRFNFHCLIFCWPSSPMCLYSLWTFTASNPNT